VQNLDGHVKIQRIVVGIPERAMRFV